MKPLLLVVALVFVGCSELSPNDSPLPEPQALLDRFDRLRLDLGEGVICRGEIRSCRGGGHGAEAFFFDYGDGPLASTEVRLINGEERIGLSATLPKIAFSELAPGVRYNAQFTYSENGGRGGGYVYFTHVSRDRLAGVYAVDTRPGGFVPAYYRVLGVFNAGPSPG
jgi:hypothetical protein